MKKYKREKRKSTTPHEEEEKAVKAST